MSAKRTHQPIERKREWLAPFKKLRGPSALVLVFLVLDWIGRIETVANLVSLGGKFPAIVAFVESSLGAVVFGTAFFWAAYTLSTGSNRRTALAFLLLGICSVCYGAFLLGQRAPPPSVQLKYIDPFILDKTNNPIARVNGNLISIPVKPESFWQYADNHRIAAACRPVIPGNPLHGDEHIQVGMFQTVMPQITLELALSQRTLGILCRHDQPALYCGVVMAKKGATAKFNYEMNLFRAEDYGIKPFPSIAMKDIEFNIFKNTKIDFAGCDAFRKR